MTKIEYEVGKWYYLDPDNRKDEPKGLFCARCLKPVMNVGFVRIVKHYDAPWFKVASLKEKEDGIIGLDCLKKVVKEYGEM